VANNIIEFCCFSLTLGVLFLLLLLIEQIVLIFEPSSEKRREVMIINTTDFKFILWIIVGISCLLEGLLYFKG
jgi:hypothetical protein